MKLIRLEIGEKFRGLQAGFELHFLRERDSEAITNDFTPYVLAGPNGSGKSNVLEVLAAIFYQVECQYLNYRPEVLIPPDDNGLGKEEQRDYGQSSAVFRPNVYELEYLIPVPDRLRIGGIESFEESAHIKISKTADNSAQLFWLNHPDYGEEKPLSRMEAWELLPTFVLAYSSGENEILSLPFFKMRFIQFDEYLDSLKNETSYAGKPESRQVFLDNAFSQAILISNLLFEEGDVLQPFKKEVGIEGLLQFRIILKKSIEISVGQAEGFPDGFLIIEENEMDSSKTYRLPLLHAFESDAEEKFKSGLIDRLQRCATCSYHDVENDTLYLDYLVTEATRETFKNNFTSAIDLFQYLQILLVLNLYSVSESLKKDLYLSDSLYVNETIPTLPSDARVMRFKDLELKKDGVEETIYAKSLSDGEYQFLHCLGLCLLYRNTNSLFLLDEPETHFNPDWRSQLITRLRDCFKYADPKIKAQRDMLITTHSPFLLSDSPSEQVLVFAKEDNIVTVVHPEFNTLGASVDQITMLTFKKGETIGGYAASIIQKFEKRFKDGEDRGKILREINKELGDSIEKIYLIKTIQDSMRGK